MRQRAQFPLHLLLHHLPLGCRSRFPLDSKRLVSLHTLTLRLYPKILLNPSPSAVSAALPSTSYPVITSKIYPNWCLLETFPGSLSPSLRCPRSHQSCCRPFHGYPFPPDRHTCATSLGFSQCLQPQIVGPVPLWLANVLVILNAVCLT